MTKPRESANLADRVGEFAYRCGRVLAVPIAGDRELLEKAHKMAISADETGKMQFLHLLPPELQLDAVAARARPVFLKDRCSYRTGLGALRRLVRKSDCEDASEYDDAITDLVAGWNAITDPPGQRYYSASRKVGDTQPVSSWSEEQLADAWLNGDLVHADEGHQHVATRKQRLIAGWARQAEIIKLARTSVEFVHGFNQHLGLEIPGWAFDTEDHAHGLVSGGELLGAFRAPAAGAMPDQSSISAGLVSAIETLEAPSSDYESFQVPPGQTLWFTAFPHKS